MLESNRRAQREAGTAVRSSWRARARRPESPDRCRTKLALGVELRQRVRALRVGVVAAASRDGHPARAGEVRPWRAGRPASARAQRPHRGVDQGRGVLGLRPPAEPRLRPRAGAMARRAAQHRSRPDRVRRPLRRLGVAHARRHRLEPAVAAPRAGGEPRHPDRPDEADRKRCRSPPRRVRLCGSNDPTRDCSSRPPCGSTASFGMPPPCARSDAVRPLLLHGRAASGSVLVLAPAVLHRARPRAALGGRAAHRARPRTSRSSWPINSSGSFGGPRSRRSGIALPQPARPTLVLNVRFAPGHQIEYDFAWDYDGLDPSAVSERQP